MLELNVSVNGSHHYLLYSGHSAGNKLKSVRVRVKVRVRVSLSALSHFLALRYQ